jgi:RecA/RadA recombinase
MSRKSTKKSAAVEEVANSSLAARALFKIATSSLDKAGVTLDAEEYDEEFKVAKCISTGIPSLDLYLKPNHDNTQWGIPVGLVTTIAGDEASLKTTLCHRIAGSAMRDGGFGLWLQSEGEFDAQYAAKNWADVGFTPDQLSDAPIKVVNIYKIQDIFDALVKFFDKLEVVYREFVANFPNREFRDAFPPIFVIIDSIGGTMAASEHDSLEDQTAKGGWDNAVRPGASASELHRIFKFFTNKCSKYNVAWVNTNHIRNKIGGYGNPRMLAHETAIKYYSSIILDLDHCPVSKTPYAFLYKSFTRKGRSFQKGFPLRVKVLKMRGQIVGDGEFSIPYYFNYGFDFYNSLVDALVICGIVQDTENIWKFAPDKTIKQQVLEAPEFEPFRDKIYVKADASTKFTKDEFIDLISSKDEYALNLLQLAYKVGPRILEDTRGANSKKTKDDDED